MDQSTEHQHHSLSTLSNKGDKVQHFLIRKYAEGKVLYLAFIYKHLPAWQIRNFVGGSGISGKLGNMIPQPDTDEALMQLYCKGDLLAFKELYQRHSHGLYRFISWRSPRREWVDEIVQDSWAALHTARTSYTPLAGFRTYLYQIARNRLIDLLRQKESQLVQENDGIELKDTTDIAHDGLSPEAALDKKQQNDRLHAAIRILPNDQKEALVLQQFNGLSLEEIALVTAVPVETVKSRLRYAMQKLRSQLHSQTKQGEPA